MSNATTPTLVKWIFEDDAARFLSERGASDELEPQSMQHLPDLGDLVSWPWVANDQPFEVTLRWFTWDAERKAVVQISLGIPQMD